MYILISCNFFKLYFVTYTVLNNFMQLLFTKKLLNVTGKKDNFVNIRNLEF